MITPNPTFTSSDVAIWFIVAGDKLLQQTDSPGILKQTWAQLTDFHAYQDDVVQVGHAEDTPCFMVDLGAEGVDNTRFELVSLRSLLMQLPVEMFGVLSRAWQVALFLRTHRFCGQCGSHMEMIAWELASQCRQCQHRCYPRISPCIIVAIKHQSKILLAQGRHHKNGMYSTLAGFVESGETLEDAVHREVFEEVGVQIENLRYFGSQPWPFPHSLMCGFLADYKAGDIRVDEKEIVAAKWFDLNDLPFTPPTFSIAGQLIEATQKLVYPE